MKSTMQKTATTNWFPSAYASISGFRGMKEIAAFIAMFL